MTEMEKAAATRNTLKKRLAQLQESCEKIIASMSPEEAQNRVSQLDGIFEKFEAAQELIEDFYTHENKDNDELDAQITIRDLFESDFYRFKAKLQRIASQNTAQKPKPTPSNSETHPIATRHPEINIPKFAGKIEDFPTFLDIFKSSIDSDTRLKPVQKLVYLKLALQGEASDLIKSLPTTENNYDVALDMLVKRYENKKILVNAYLKNLIHEKSADDSASELKRILDSFRNNVNGLRQCGEQVETWNSILGYLLTSKFHPKTREEWELRSSPNTIEKTETLIEFLENRIRALTVCNQINQTKFANSKPTTKPNAPSIRAHVATTTEGNQNPASSCIFCGEPHPNFRCPTIQKMAHEKILKTLKNSRACINCMRVGHSSHTCERMKCRKCGKPHHTILHLENNKSSLDAPNATTPQSTPASSMPSNNDNQSKIIIRANMALTHSNLNPGLLATISAVAFDSHETPHSIRALFDPGAQCCFITSRFAEKLGLPLKEECVPIEGIASLITESEHRVDLKIGSKTSEYIYEITALVLNTVSPPLPSEPLSENYHEKLANLTLADPEFHKTAPVDLILGINLLPHILLPADLPGRVNSTFGWLICGAMPQPKAKYTRHVVSKLAVNHLLEKFWQIEEISNKPNILPEHEVAERHFQENVTRTPSGRFVVRLPFSQSPDTLGNSRETAIHILKYTFPKLTPSQKELYSNFIREYIALGHATKLSPEQVSTTPHFYLPHHSVIKDSVSTPLRVVFNASRKTTTQTSLNDILHVGPVIQRELVKILIKFRFFAIGMCADVEKMYRMVLVDPADRPMQRIVWFNEHGGIEDYELNTLTYGTACASFLSCRAVHELANLESSKYPDASRIVKQDFYVDDLISGVDSLLEGKTLVRELDELMSSGGFKLRKWATNQPEILTSLNDPTSYDFLFMKEEKISALGIRWLTTSDHFQFSITFSQPATDTLTKRAMLSECSRLFDPMGLLAPIIVVGKILFQSLWLSGIDWNTAVPTDIKSKWFTLRDQLCTYIFEIPRRVCFQPHNFELHGFSDSSSLAYAACIYVRSCNSDGEIIVRLLCAKTRVAPIKTVSIPRLELCGAVLLTRLIRKVKSSIRYSPKSTFLWTDSKVVLDWLKKHPSTWKTFVANRISEIHESTNPEMWKYVPGKINPADLASRGVLPSQLDTTLWWNGPPFLKESDTDSWPTMPNLENVIDSSLEARTIKLNCLSSITTTSVTRMLVERYSNIRTLFHVTAYCLRYRTNTARPRNLGPLTHIEILNATHCIISLVQREMFPREFEKLFAKSFVGKRSNLRSLNPFIDHDNIIRVGGRLEHANLSYDEKHPIILLSNHTFTTLLIRKTHLELCHGSRNAVLGTLRLKYWIVHAKSAVRKVLNKCITCKIKNGRTRTQLMGDLPIHRITPSHAFMHVGVDLAGPFQIRNSISNSRSFVKAYIVVFVCCQVKAIHIELVTSLSSDSFLVALSNFISRRGRPAIIYSDNGTNFVGANRELKSIFESIQSACTEHAIQWTFIPPSAPHIGGLWEASVKLVKRHLLSTIKSTRSLTYEELYAILVRVEASLNCRPLCAASDDAEDLSVLTPAHFLIGRSLSSIPSPDAVIPIRNLKDSFKVVQKATRDFWNKWSKDYLLSLQNRVKWQQRQPNLKINDLIVLPDSGYSPDHWRLARILAVHPGADGLVRVCTIKTADGILRRPITKFVVLSDL